MRRTLAVATVLLAAGAAGAVEIHGDAIAEYRDGEFSHPDFNPAAFVDDLSNPSTWRFVQADVTLRDQLGDYHEVFARATFAPGVPNIVTEAWIAQDGLGPGRLTFGQFYKPRGAPIPTLGLTMPTLLFRTFSVVGLKYGGSWGTSPLRYEAGVVNTNPITLTGASVGDAFLIGRPHDDIFPEGPRELYGHVGYANGGAWGSIDAGVTATFGELTSSDVATLNGSGLFTRNSLDDNRQQWEAFADYLYGPFHAYVDFARANEGDLRHEAWAIGASYWIRPDVRLTIAHDDYDINADVVSFATPASWDRDRTSFGAIWEYAPGIQFQAEYEWNDEDVARDPIGRPIENDVFTLQVLTYF